MNVMSIEVATLAFQLGASLFSLWPFIDWSFHSSLPTFLLHDVKSLHVFPSQPSKT